MFGEGGKDRWSKSVTPLMVWDSCQWKAQRRSDSGTVGKEERSRGGEKVVEYNEGRRSGARLLLSLWLRGGRTERQQRVCQTVAAFLLRLQTGTSGRAAPSRLGLSPEEHTRLHRLFSCYMLITRRCLTIILLLLLCKMLLTLLMSHNSLTYSIMQLVGSKQDEPNVSALGFSRAELQEIDLWPCWCLGLWRQTLQLHFNQAAARERQNV